MAQEEITQTKLDLQDARYPVVVLVRAVKASGDGRR
jgi:hypothetical protein